MNLDKNMTLNLAAEDGSKTWKFVPIVMTSQLVLSYENSGQENQANNQKDGTIFTPNVT